MLYTCEGVAFVETHSIERVNIKEGLIYFYLIPHIFSIYKGAGYLKQYFPSSVLAVGSGKKKKKKF